MSQEKPINLIDSIQAEVSKEASPMLEFLVKHSVKLIALIVALVLAIILSGVISYKNKSSLEEKREALGKILLMPESEKRLNALQSYADNASDEFKTTALLALATSKTNAKDYAGAANTWAEAAKSSNKMSEMVALIGQAEALSNAGKHDESLAMLESLLPRVEQDSASLINSMIVDEAQILGRFDRAIKACDDIIASPSLLVNPAPWKQRAAFLRQQKK